MGVDHPDMLSQSVLKAYQRLAWENLRKVPVFPPLPRDYVPPTKWERRRRRWKAWWRKLPTYRLHAAGECPRDLWD